MMELAGLGQTYVEATPMQDLQVQYENLRQWSTENFGPEFTNTVLPVNVFNAMGRRIEKVSIPWWGWLLIGLLAGRILRI